MARDISIPLPLRGVFIEAKTAEISGIYAGELTNWQSNGSSLRLRSQHVYAANGAVACKTGAGAAVLQRIPFEFGAAAQYIEVEQGTIRSGDFSTPRTFSKPMGVAYISSNAVLADGNGAPLLFSQAGFSNSAFTTTTGVDPKTLDGVIGHQDRLFFWKTGGDLDFYYGDVGGVSGPLARFPLGRLGNITGTILCCKSLTVDAGHGMNDTLAIFTSTGNIVVYEGLNPGDTQDWRQLTRIKTAPPVSKDAFVEVGSDLWMLTASGVVSVQQTVRDSSLALVSTMSRAIQEKLVAQIAEGGEWSMHLSADALRVVINRVYKGVSAQFIYYTDSKSWSEASFPALRWHNLGRKTEFTALDGDLATLDPGGSELISAKWVSSWFRLPRSGGITYLQPTIIADGPLAVTVTLLSDHDTLPGDVSEASQTVTIQPDNTPGAGERVALNEIIAVDAVGDVFQLRMEVTAKWAELISLKAGVI